MAFDKPIIGIMACDPNGVVGNKGKLPWNYESELEHFRRTTAGHTVIMGRETFDNTPQRLFQTRLGIVFSYSARTAPPGLEGRVQFVRGLDEFKGLPAPGQDKAFLIGGAQLAGFFLKNGLVSEFILTRIKKPHAGDAVLDLSLFDRWGDAVLQDTPDYTIHKLTKPEKTP